MQSSRNEISVRALGLPDLGLQGCGKWRPLLIHLRHGSMRISALAIQRCF
jgi:hypothetical protein